MRTSRADLEQNALRYQAVPVTVRFESGRLVSPLRVAVAGYPRGRAGRGEQRRAASPAGGRLAARLGARGRGRGCGGLGARAAALAAGGGRVRLIGGSAGGARRALHGRLPAVAVYPGEGRLGGPGELLPFPARAGGVRPAHRFGSPRRIEIPALAPATRSGNPPLGRGLQTTPPRASARAISGGRRGVHDAREACRVEDLDRGLVVLPGLVTWRRSSSGSPPVSSMSAIAPLKVPCASRRACSASKPGSAPPG